MQSKLNNCCTIFRLKTEFKRLVMQKSLYIIIITLVIILYYFLFCNISVHNNKTLFD